MKKALKIVGVVILTLVAVVFIGAAFLPSKVQIKETKIIKASPDKIYSQVICFKNWDAWTPWKEEFVNQRFEGPECGTGAKQLWDGVDGASGGHQIITEVAENSLIRTKLDFQENGSALASWTFKKVEYGTEVTWSMDSEMDYPIGRWFGALLIKPMVTDSYIRGLNSLEEHVVNMK